MVLIMFTTSIMTLGLPIFCNLVSTAYHKYHCLNKTFINIKGNVYVLSYEQNIVANMAAENLLSPSRLSFSWVAFSVYSGPTSSYSLRGPNFCVNCMPRATDDYQVIDDCGSPSFFSPQMKRQVRVARSVEPRQLSKQRHNAYLASTILTGETM